jgi:ketosteroid isomerase-like protein
MKCAAYFLLSLLLTHTVTGTGMNHTDALTNYVQKLNTHVWGQISPLVTDDVVFVFTEGTFVGKEAAQTAFEKTFNLIKGGEYSIHAVSWTAVTDSMACCYYEFRWKGRIDGEEASGGGRGTSILVKVNGKWLIAHEHLGPYPRKS